MSSILPNTTQIPHIIIRGWMPKLKDVELRVLLVVVDQTLGWIEDVQTGRRKEKDWISHYQLRQKTGRRDRAISMAVRTLIETHHIIEAYSEHGELLDTTWKRQKLGSRIYYRLNLHPPPEGLFDTPAKFAGAVNKMGKTPYTPAKSAYAKNADNKRNSYYKNNYYAGGNVDKSRKPL